MGPRLTSTVLILYIGLHLLKLLHELMNECRDLKPEVPMTIVFWNSISGLGEGLSP